jgi:hypothetical protein
MTFLSVSSQVCRWLPSDLPSRKRPCLKLVVVVTRIYKSDHLDVGSPTRDFHPMSSRPAWAYTIILAANKVLILRFGHICRRSASPLCLSQTSLFEKVRASLEPRQRNKAFSLSKPISVSILQTFCVPMSSESLNRYISEASSAKFETFRTR